MRKTTRIRTSVPRIANDRTSRDRDWICARRDLMPRRAWLARVACHTKNPAAIARRNAKARSRSGGQDQGVSTSPHHTAKCH